MKILRLIPIALIATIAALFSGCASTSATTAPGADIASVRKIHVVKLPADSRGIDRILGDELNLMGYKATVGSKADVPADADAILTYQDKWMWDITMYMIELNVQLREPKSDMTLATAKSYRPSLQRKSPPEMAKEVLSQILPKK